MDAINNDIYLSTIFNACEEKVLTYEELLQKVNLYAKSANFDEETLNHILEEVEKFRIHKKEYSNDEKRTYLSKLMLDEDTEKYGTKIVDSMSDAAVDKVFENEVKEIKDEDIDNIINPKKAPVKVKVRVRNEIPNIEVAKEVASDNDKLERALIETYNGVTIEEILNALIDSRKRGMTLPTTQPMEHLVMYYALKGRKGLTLDEKQRILREVKSEKERDKAIVKRVLDKINEENKKENVSVKENKVEAKEKKETPEMVKKEEVLEPVDKLDKQLVRNVAGNNYYLERAILLGSFNGTKLEDILNGIINLRKNGEEIACTREMNYLVDSYAIFGKLNATILNSTLDKITNVRKEEEKTEEKKTDANVELAIELANNSEMLEAALVSKSYKGVALESLVKALVDAKKQGITLETNEAMNALISEYEKEGKITEECLKNVKLLLAKERLNREKGYAFSDKKIDELDNNNNNKGFAFGGKNLDSLDNDEATIDDKKTSKEEDKKEQKGVKFSDLSEEDYKNAERNINDAKDSNVRKVEASEERIRKLKMSKSKAKSIALKSLIIVCGLVMLGPEAGMLGIGSYTVFAILIRQGIFNPKTKIGKSIKDTVIKVMGWGYSDEDKYDLLKNIASAENEVKEKKKKEAEDATKKKEEKENKSEEKEEEKGGKTK